MSHTTFIDPLSVNTHTPHTHCWTLFLPYGSGQFGPLPRVSFVTDACVFTHFKLGFFFLFVSFSFTYRQRFVYWMFCCKWSWWTEGELVRAMGTYLWKPKVAALNLAPFPVLPSDVKRGIYLYTYINKKKKTVQFSTSHCPNDETPDTQTLGWPCIQPGC